MVRATAEYGCVRFRMSHVPVLLARSLDALHPAPGEVYADGTAGLGGHAAAVAGRMKTGTVVLGDLDAGNLGRAAAAVEAAFASAPEHPRSRILSFHTNFAELPRRIEEAGLRADMFLADLGFASVHVDDPARGFSFMRDGPLDMRMDTTRPLTAADLVASLPEKELARIIADYGEDRAAGRIARKLVQARAGGPIRTTAQLAGVVRAAVGGGGGPIDPATRTFQALRIAVNDELGSLAALLAAVEADARRILSGGAGRWLAAGARVAFITFHSLEDRPVKRVFASLIAAGATDITDGPAAASESEVRENPRARSAKLRVIRLTPY